MSSVLAASAALITVLGALPFDIPPLPLSSFEADPAPVIGAEAYLLYDVTGDLVLVSHEPDQRRAMASVTKLMTALVVLDNAELGDAVVVSESAAATGEAEVGLVAGETWTVWELLNAIVVRSGNDAATALAEHVGGSVAGFSALMNAKAVELGMLDSSFVNPHGLDADGHFSSAHDLLLLGLAALDQPVIAELMRTEVVKFRASPEGAERRALNTNELLGAFEGVVGMKTGFTGEAGRVLISAATRGGRTLVGVVMGSEDHFADSRELLEHGFRMFGIADRVLAPLAAGTPASFDPSEAARLQLVPALPVLDASAPRTPTPLEERLEEVLRSLLPPIVVP